MGRPKPLTATGLAFLLILLPLSVVGEQGCQWVETKGEAALENVTAEEARQLALRGARARAVEQVAGVELHSQTLIRDEVLAGEFLRSLAHGYVLAERNLRWEQDVFQKGPGTPPLTVYRVYLEACVSPQGGARDPYFTVVAEINKTAFVAGEEASIKVRCSRECYVTIFNLAASDHFSILLPNSYQSATFLKPHDELTFPPRGLALAMHPVAGHRQDTEAFLIVATRQQFDAHTRLGRREVIPMGEVFRVLLDVPASERAEALLVYEVRAK